MGIGAIGREAGKRVLSVIRKIKPEDLMYNMVTTVDDTHKNVKMWGDMC